VNWYSKLTSSAGYNDNSMIDRGLSDVVEIGMEGEGMSGGGAVSPWHRPGAENGKRSKRRREKRRRRRIGTAPQTMQGALPGSATGNAPDGTGLG
jgi:hypothetical protein